MKSGVTYANAAGLVQAKRTVQGLSGNSLTKEGTEGSF